MPGVHKIDLIGQEVVAAHLGVTSQAISMWFNRAKKAPEGSHLHKLPVPTLIRFKEGKTPRKAWRVNQLPVWDKWYDKHLEDQGDHIPGRNRNMNRKAA